MATDINLERRESPTIRTGIVAAVLAGILLTLVLIAFGLMLFFPDRIGVSFVPRRAFPAPAVIPDEPIKRESLEARQRSELNGRDGRLPITDAMKAIVARGPHAFEPVNK